MAEYIVKENAIAIIKEAIGKQQGCSMVQLYDAYKEAGGTYYITSRNDSTKYNFEELFSSLLSLEMVSVAGEPGHEQYYINDYCVKQADITFAKLPKKCSECRFLVSDPKANPFCETVTSKHACLLNLKLKVGKNEYAGKWSTTFACPLMDR